MTNWDLFMSADDLNLWERMVSKVLMWRHLRKHPDHHEWIAFIGFRFLGRWCDCDDYVAWLAPGHKSWIMSKYVKLKEEK